MKQVRNLLGEANFDKDRGLLEGPEGGARSPSRTPESATPSTPAALSGVENGLPTTLSGRYVVLGSRWRC